MTPYIIDANSILDVMFAYNPALQSLTHTYKLGGCPFNGGLCVFEISPRNTGTIFADCPAMTLAVLTPPCSFPCLAGGELAFPLIARRPLTRHCYIASIVSRADNNSARERCTCSGVWRSVTIFILNYCFS